MTEILHQYKKNFLLLYIFLFLSMSLFLGDGQQMLIDMVGACGVLVLSLLAFFYGKKRRSISLFPLVAFFLFITYVLIVLPYSDDIGYSVYTVVRWIEYFLLFYIVYSYADDSWAPLFIHGSIVTVCVAFAGVFIATFTSWLSAILPKTTLFTPTYGHNNIVYLLLFSYPYILWMSVIKRKKFAIFLLIFYWCIIIFSFSRGTFILVAMGTELFLLYLGHMFLSRKSIVLYTGLVVCLTITYLLFITLPQELYVHFIPQQLLPQKAKEIELGVNRIEYFRQAIQSFSLHLWIGSGPGTFYFESKRFQIAPGMLSRYTHNFVLELLSEIGLIGIVFLSPLWGWIIMRALYAFRKFHDHNGNLYLLIGIGVILQLTSGFIDYSMDFYVIDMLMGAALGIILANQSSSLHEESFIEKITIGIFLVFVGVFYIFVTGCGLGVPFYNDTLASCCFLSESATAYAIESKKITPNDIHVIQTFHRNNGDVLRQLLPYMKGEDAYILGKKLLTLDPKDKEMYEFVFQNVGYEQRYPKKDLLLLLSKEFLPTKQYKDAETLLQVLPTESAMDMVLFDLGRHRDIPMFLAKQYYRIGYMVRKTHPEKAANFWRLSATIDPGLSFYWTELASLSARRFNDEKQAVAFLDECMEYFTPRRHCYNLKKLYLQQGIQAFPEVGAMKDAIYDIL